MGGEEDCITRHGRLKSSSPADTLGKRPFPPLDSLITLFLQQACVNSRMLADCGYFGHWAGPVTKLVSCINPSLIGWVRSSPQKKKLFRQAGLSRRPIQPIFWDLYPFPFFILISKFTDILKFQNKSGILVYDFTCWVIDLYYVHINLI